MHAPCADHTPMVYNSNKVGVHRAFSAFAVLNSLKQLVVPRYYKKNVLVGVKVLGVLGETVSRPSPETRLALNVLLVVSAWARVCSLFLIPYIAT